MLQLLNHNPASFLTIKYVSPTQTFDHEYLAGEPLSNTIPWYFPLQVKSSVPTSWFGKTASSEG